MYAQNIHDLERALKAAEQSDQTLVDLQIDRGLLRVLLVESRQHQNAQILLASAQRHSGYSGLIDTAPLQVDSLPKNGPSTPVSGPNSHHYTRLEQLIAESRQK